MSSILGPKIKNFHISIFLIEGLRYVNITNFTSFTVLSKSYLSAFISSFKEIIKQFIKDNPIICPQSICFFDIPEDGSVITTNLNFKLMKKVPRSEAKDLFKKLIYQLEDARDDWLMNFSSPDTTKKYG